MQHILSVNEIEERETISIRRGMEGKSQGEAQNARLHECPYKSRMSCGHRSLAGLEMCLGGLQTLAKIHMNHASDARWPRDQNSTERRSKGVHWNFEASFEPKSLPSSSEHGQNQIEL